MSADEHWLAIPGWQGLYSVSNRFRVRTEPRTVERTNGAQFTTQGCIRRLEERKSGALMCKLRRPGYAQTIHVGRVVAELFGTETPANNDYPPANNGDDLANTDGARATPANNPGWSPWPTSTMHNRRWEGVLNPSFKSRSGDPPNSACAGTNLAVF